MNRVVSPKDACWVLDKEAVAYRSLTLFCFSFAGGGASVFRSWLGQFPPGVQVYSVQLPGRESRIRENAFRQMGPLADAATEGLKPYFQPPYIFFGHSMGAILAFEIARRLRAMQHPDLDLLIASGSPAPQAKRVAPITFNLPDDELINELRRLEGTPKEVLDSPEIMQVLLPVIRADFEVIQTYAYRDDTPLNCPIVAIGGAEDHQVGLEQLEAWRHQTAREFSCYTLPGNHFFLFASQSALIRVILEHLQKHIRFSRTNGHSGNS